MLRIVYPNVEAKIEAKMVMELMPNGSLLDLLRKQKGHDKWDKPTLLTKLQDLRWNESCHRRPVNHFYSVKASNSLNLRDFIIATSEPTIC